MSGSKQSNECVTYHFPMVLVVVLKNLVSLSKQQLLPVRFLQFGNKPSKLLKIDP